MKIDVKQLFWKKKKWILSVTAIVLVLAIGCGIWYYVGHTSSEPVYVFDFNYVGMTEYWGDSQESYGPVTTDKIQTVFLSDTQSVTEILVAEGDTVKKGDLLMTFDTTLSDLALERERLEVEKLKLKLEDAQERLAEIKNMKPMVIPDFSDDDTGEEENLGAALGSAYKISTQTGYDGSSQEKALICWIGSDTSVDDSLLEALRQRAEEFQNGNAQKQPSSASAPLTDDDGDGEAPTEEPTEAPTEAPTEEPTEAPTEQPTEEPTEGPIEEPTEPAYEPFPVNQYYVIFKVTQGNMSLGRVTVWQGMQVTRDTETGAFRMKFFDASGNTDFTLAQEGGGSSEDLPQIDFGSGYTAAQIAQLRSEQEKAIKDLQFEIKMAEADYKIMQTEVSDGNVYSEIDGTVVSVLTEEEAKMQMQPILKVSGGGGFYIAGSVSELEKDNMELGQEVTINDWNTGMTYTGTVTALGDFPSANGYWNGMGNPNATYYPFTVFVDESADLRAGYYVSIQYSAGVSQNGIYLQNPFLRTEQGKSYVYVLGENGRLEQRYVTTGKSLWGSYTEILDGLTAEDLVAFPYGKNVKPGAKAVEGDLSDLYS